MPKPKWHAGIHIEAHSKEWEIWKDDDGSWHGDMIAYGEYGTLPDEEALRVAVRCGFEPVRIVVDRKAFRKKVKNLAGITLKKASELLGYDCFRTFAREYEKGWCSTDFAMRMCSLLHTDIPTVFGENQPFAESIIPKDARFYQTMRDPQ